MVSLWCPCFSLSLLAHWEATQTPVANVATYSKNFLENWVQNAPLRHSTVSMVTPLFNSCTTSWCNLLYRTRPSIRTIPTSPASLKIPSLSLVVSVPWISTGTHKAVSSCFMRNVPCRACMSYVNSEDADPLNQQFAYTQRMYPTASHSVKPRISPTRYSPLPATVGPAAPSPQTISHRTSLRMAAL